MSHEEDETTAAARPTDAPRVGPTVVPPFDLEAFARDSGFRNVPSLLSDMILEVVSDVSWSEAQLDLIEIELIGHIDGISPVTLLESVVAVSRDELHAMLVALLARGFVRVAESPPEAVPTSGIYRRVGAEGEIAWGDDEDLSRAG